jgi:hypothetical protein
MYGYRHSCGEIAFYLDHRPDAFDQTSAEGVFHVDGRRMYDGEAIECDACGGGISPSTKNIEEVHDLPWPKST